MPKADGGRGALGSGRHRTSPVDRCTRRMESAAPHARPRAISVTPSTVISLPWSARAFPSVKGVLHQPEAKLTPKQETRDAILLAIAKARLDRRCRIGLVINRLRALA
jgi:hypothetical protein